MHVVKVIRYGKVLRETRHRTTAGMLLGLGHAKLHDAREQVDRAGPRGLVQVARQSPTCRAQATFSPSPSSRRRSEAVPTLRRKPRHAAKLSGPFDLGEGGPGGWRILIEPEVRFPDRTEPRGFHVVDPDLAGWRRERMPEIIETAYIELAPDWVCEVLSPSTEKHDRETKMPLYAENGVRWAWLIDPLKRTLEVYVLGAGRAWNDPTMHKDAARVHAVPFELKELDLSALWR